MNSANTVKVVEGTTLIINYVNVVKDLKKPIKIMNLRKKIKEELLKKMLKKLKLNLIN
tara:strand:+ start:84 stop:257 length:174 start_codon:yes stop_codon:yes gene_type:complete